MGVLAVQIGFHATVQVSATVKTTLFAATDMASPVATASSDLAVVAGATANVTQKLTGK